MSSVVKAITGGSKPDNSGILAEQRKQQEKLDKREAEADAKIAARKNVDAAGTGARNLLASGRGRGAGPGLASILGTS